MHGYDVLDHTRVSAELGGEDGPACASPRPPASTTWASSSTSCPTTWRWSRPSRPTPRSGTVLRHGRDAAHAHWFDVDWNVLDGRLGLPVLGEHARRDAGGGRPARSDEHDGQPVLRYFDHVFPVAPTAPDGDDVAEVLAAPALPCSPAGASATTVLNYRRFFDVDQLIAIRVELPDVFDATHAVLLDAQPRRRHRRLPDRPPGRAGRPRGLPRAAARRLPARHARSGSRRSSRATSGCPPPGPATAPPGTTRRRRSRPPWSTRPPRRPSTEAWAEPRRRARRWSGRSTRPSARCVDQSLRPGASTG